MAWQSAHATTGRRQLDAPLASRASGAGAALGTAAPRPPARAAVSTRPTAGRRRRRRRRRDTYLVAGHLPPVGRPPHPLPSPSPGEGGSLDPTVATCTVRSKY